MYFAWHGDSYSMLGQHAIWMTILEDSFLLSFFYIFFWCEFFMCEERRKSKNSTDCSWQTRHWGMIPCMMQIRGLKWCHHHFTISAMLNFRTTGVEFGKCSRTKFTFVVNIIWHILYVNFLLFLVFWWTEIFVLQGRPWYIRYSCNWCTT